MEVLHAADALAHALGRGAAADELCALVDTLPAAALFTTGSGGMAPVHMLLADRADAPAARVLEHVLVHVCGGAVGGWVNVRSEASHTPLTHALQRGHAACARALLACARVDTCLMPVSGVTALMLAAGTGDVPLLERVWARVRAGGAAAAGPRAVSRFEGSTLLMWAVRSGAVGMVERCVAWRGCDVNAVDRHGQHALIRASRGGHKAVARVLVEHGAALHWRDAAGRTAAEYVYPSRERAGWESDMRAAHRVYVAVRNPPEMRVLP